MLEPDASSAAEEADAPAAPRYNIVLLRPIARWCQATLGEWEFRRFCDESGLQPEWFEESTRWVTLEQFEAALSAARRRVESDEEFAAVSTFEYAQTYRRVRLMTWALTPALTFRAAERIGGFFSTAGRFEFLGARRNSARLRWVSACRESRLMCLSRRAQATQSPTLWGMPPAHVREHACIARGDDCCDYEFYWLNRKRPLPVLVGTAGGLAGTWVLDHLLPLPALAAWAVPTMGAVAGYLYESLQVERGNSATQTDIADSFRDLVADAAQANRRASELEERLRAAERAAARIDTFVGREAEMATLGMALQDASAGRRRLVLVSGEPGVGKTRLAEEFGADAQRRGSRVLTGRCHAGEGAPALWPWVQILRSATRNEAAAVLSAELGNGAAEIGELLPELGPREAVRPWIESNQARFRLFDAVASFLQRSSVRAPLVLVLDDLQWADRPTLLLLQFLLSQAPQARILVIGIYRDGEPGDVLTESLPDLIREPGCEPLALTGLPREQLATFIASVEGGDTSNALRDAVYDLTEGNPLFTREVVRLLASEGRLDAGGAAGAPRIALPQSVREVVRRRLGRLSADCNRLLEVAAVIGRDFVLDRAGLVTELDRARLLEITEEALQARVIRAVTGRSEAYSFSHAVVREVLYEGIPPLRRAEIHDGIAAALEQASAGDSSISMAELAHHYAEAANAGGSIEKAVVYAHRAGEAALRLAAFEDAVRAYQRGLDLLARQPSGDEVLRCELLLSLSEAQMRAGDASASRERSIQAALLARKLGLHGLFAKAALGFGWWFRVGVVDQERIDLLEDALAAIGDGDGPLRAKLLARLAESLYWVPESHARRERLSTEAIAEARRIGDVDALAFALNARLYALWLPGDADLRLEASRELLQLAESARDVELALQSRHWIVADLMEVGDIESASREIATHAVQAQLARQPLYLWFAAAWRAMRALLEGRFGEVEPLAEQALNIGLQAEPDNARAVYFTVIFWLRREQSRLGEIVDAFSALPSANPRYESPYQAGLSLVCAEVGREAEARRALDSFLASGYAGGPRDNAWLPAVATASEACAILNDARAARELYEHLAPFARRNVIVGMAEAIYGSVSRHLGLLAWTMGRWSEAEEHLRDALDMHERLRARPLIARTQHDLARLLVARDAAGDRVEAAALLASAIGTARDLGLVSVLHGALAVQELLAGEASRDDAAASPEATPPRGDLRAHLRHDGAYWTLSWDGTTSHLKNSRGLHYLARLVSNPRQEAHVLDLIQRPAAAPARAADFSGLPILDPAAKAAYRDRLAELRAELEEAQTFNDLGRAERARQEIEAIGAELAAAVGLGGRERQSGAATDRARSTVTQRLRAAIQKIAEQQPVLGEHLARCVKTGFFCVYLPDALARVEWIVDFAQM